MFLMVLKIKIVTFCLSAGFFTFFGCLFVEKNQVSACFFVLLKIFLFSNHLQCFFVLTFREPPVTLTVVSKASYDIYTGEN
jgi:hypothetical protein